jgi:nicotinamidase-related amidase
LSGALALTGRYFRQYPLGSYQGSAEKQLQLNIEETAILVVDVYGLGESTNHSHVGLGNQHSTDMAQQIIEASIKPALDAARRSGVAVIYVANSAPRIALNQSAYWEQKWDTQHVDKDELYSEDTVDPLEYHYGDSNVLKYVDAVVPQAGDYFVRKHTHSGFFDTRLDTLLRNLRIRNLVCVGFTLDMCLGATMMDALWRNYRVLLLRDCTYAAELPLIDEPGSWTQRWITYVECAIGCISTSSAFIHACSNIVPNATSSHVTPE